MISFKIKTIFIIYFFSLNAFARNTLDDIKINSTNNLKLVEISKNQMDNVILLSKNSPNIKIKKILLNQNQKNTKDICEIVEKTMSQESSGSFQISNLGGSSGDDAAILFVIIGLVVIFAWVGYAITFLIESFIKEDKGSWVQLDLDIIGITAESGSSGVKFNRLGYMSGTRLTLGLGDLKSTNFGIVANSGYHSIYYSKTVTQFSYVEKMPPINGGYLMGGPIIFFGRGSVRVNRSYGYLEVSAGRSTNNNIGMMGLARFGGSILINEIVSNQKCDRSATYFNFNLGALYMGLKENSAIINTLDQFNLSWGIGLGYRF